MMPEHTVGLEACFRGEGPVLPPKAQARVDALLAQIQGQLADLGMPDLDTYLHTLETDADMLSASGKLVTSLNRLQRLLETGGVAGDWVHAEILHTVDVSNPILSAVGLMPNGDLIAELEGKKYLAGGLVPYVFLARIDRQSGREEAISFPVAILETLGLTKDGHVVAWTENGPHKDLSLLDVATGASGYLYTDRAEPEWSIYNESSGIVALSGSSASEVLLIDMATGKRNSLKTPYDSRRFIGVTDRGHAIVATKDQIAYVDIATGNPCFRYDAGESGRLTAMLADGSVIYTQDEKSWVYYWNPYNESHQILPIPPSGWSFTGALHPDDPDIIALVDEVSEEPTAVWIADVNRATISSRIVLPDSQPARGIFATGEGQLVVVQDQRISYIGERI